MYLIYNLKIKVLYVLLNRESKYLTSRSLKLINKY